MSVVPEGEAGHGGFWPCWGTGAECPLGMGWGGDQPWSPAEALVGGGGGWRG